MRVMLEPGQPRWPPRPVFNRCLGGPSLWVGILGVSCAMQNPVMPVFMAGLADYAGIVATAGQDKGHVLVIDQIELVNGLSRLTAQRNLFSSDQEPTSRPTDQPPPPAPLLSSSGPPKSRITRPVSKIPVPGCQLAKPIWGLHVRLSPNYHHSIDRTCPVASGEHRR
jgi:hypothetical protein